MELVVDSNLGPNFWNGEEHYSAFELDEEHEMRLSTYP
jgi:hypothetical protein